MSKNKNKQQKQNAANKVETTKVETTPQKEKPVETKETKEDKTDNIPTAPKVEAPVEVIPSEKNIPELVIPQQLENDSKFAGLSQDGRVEYAKLIKQVYMDKPDPKDKFVQTLHAAMTGVFHATMVSIAIREAVLGHNEFSLILSTYAYPQIKAIADSVGYALPSPEELKKMNSADMKKIGITPKEDTGELSLEFKEEQVSKETKAQVKAEAKTKVPELNPAKITTNAQISSALKYIEQQTDATGKAEKRLIAMVNFMKGLRMYQAKNSQDPDTEIAKYNAYTFNDWLKEVTSVTVPSLLFHAVGSVLKKTILDDHHPVRAFLSMKASMNGGELKKFSDKEIADLVSTIVGWVIGANLEADELYLKSDKLTAEQRAAKEQDIEDCHNVITYMTETDPAEIEDIVCGSKQNDESVSPMDHACFYWIFSNYFGARAKNKSVRPTEFYSNVEPNVEQIAGIIINYFRDPSNQLTQYDATNITELQVREQATTEKKVEDKPKEETTSTEIPAEQKKA